MFFAELYDTVNDAPNRVSQGIIEKFKSRIKWREDGLDKVLDVGCGTGSTLMKYMYPVLPETFDLVLGTDVSEEMIEYARRKYQDHEKCDFMLLDIRSNELPAELCGGFDHVTSFFALQWIHDQQTALANIYKLLRPEGGNCLFVILVTMTIYDIYLIMRQTPKWASHMADTEACISSLYYSGDPVKDYGELLKQAGFTNCHLELHKNTFQYQNVKQMKNLVKSVCPFMPRLTKDLQKEFLNDFAAIAENPTDYELSSEIVDGKIVFPYTILAVYAQKCPK